MSSLLPGLRCASTDEAGLKPAAGLVDGMQCFRFNEKLQTFNYWVSFFSHLDALCAELQLTCDELEISHCGLLCQLKTAGIGQ